MNEKIEHVLAFVDSQNIYANGVENSSEWDFLENYFQIKVGVQFRRLYDITNGFSNYHQKSQFILWPLRKIVCENKHFKNEKNDRSYLKIGDFLIESDYIVTDISVDNCDIKLLYENRLLSSSIASFVEDLISGKFDFLSDVVG